MLVLSRKKKEKTDRRWFRQAGLRAFRYAAVEAVVGARRHDGDRNDAGGVGGVGRRLGFSVGVLVGDEDLLFAVVGVAHRPVRVLVLDEHHVVSLVHKMASHFFIWGGGVCVIVPNLVKKNISLECGSRKWVPFKYIPLFKTKLFTLRW